MAVIDGTMGPLLIGVIICAVFYGVSLSQVYYYYTRYRRDPLYLKVLVGAVLTTDTIHQAMISHSVYWYLVTEYGHPDSLGLLSATMIPEVFFQAFTGLFVQSFYAVRVWKLSGRRLYLVIPVVAFIAAEFSVAMAYAIQALSFKTFEDLGKIKVLSISINGFAAAGDVVIAAILCTILQVSKTGFSKSNLLVNRLIVFSVNTGLLTSVCACMSLITILALPNTFVYICFFFLIGRLYSNSLMATLNARKSLREKSTIHDTSMSLRDINPSGGGATANMSPFSPTTKRDITSGIAIRIDTTQDTRHDIDEESAKYGSQDKHEGIEAV
ncbi:uncharacterized protein TRAVEDRAFT_138556 [Trametes versicolor FP-101664 SS1]|uniref:uncharacterized protein n=1 Tax=Trametes versicolor (strain FP-101664) TaxID=717944 RepID=UPI00046233D2|nr:uncharacterized protein TRAVEDRAFT_138556 [Trametes versicolor FP-101664 SS1]EIW64095.1 hypothetical protein TRAVEDRAFT_138556 [Trametes versicolor FP-101664 SS1]